ncbi:MAG TPA: glycosyltransferase [Gemmatimonadaceae bacterium]|nr:glycosyltransferase [Gemmatimonadaceae bacterium]
MSYLDVMLVAWPWVFFPLLTLWRARGSRSLDEEPAEAPADAPLVSVVIPARNEARNIAACLTSVLAARYPALEVIVVDDHSEDGTGDAARAVADARVRVLRNPPLPPGWMGKQWACATGAAAARGEILLFADADTRHASDLLPRAVAALRSRRADLLSVAGRQELGSFWERVVQPQVFAVLAARYGSTERVNRARSARDKIANGQCLLVRRDAYEAVGGHGAVRDAVAEDLVLAQTLHAAGKRVCLVLGLDQLSTRMYTSLRELVRGWRKNVYAGGRLAMRGGRAGRAVFPLLLLFPPAMALAPLAVLALAASGVLGSFALAWSAFAAACTVLFWAGVYWRVGLSPLYALAYPLGALIFLGISLQAIARGRRVSWKGREYLSS